MGHFSGFSQKPDKRKDSLTRVVKNAKEDTAKVLALYQLGQLAIDSIFKNDMLLAGTDMMTLSKNLQFQRGIALSHYVLAWYYYYIGKPTETKENIKPALTYFERSWDKVNYAKALEMQIYLSASWADGIEMEYYCKKALPVYKDVKKEKGLIEVYGHFAYAYSLSGDYGKSLEHYFKQEKLIIKLKDSALLSSVYHYLGNVLLKQGEDSLAALYLNRSIIIGNNFPGNEYEAEKNRYTLAIIDLRLGRLEKALDFFQRQLQKDLAHNQLPPISVWRDWYNIGNVFERKGDSASIEGNLPLAKVNYQKALTFSLKAFNGYCNFYDTINPLSYSLSTARLYVKLGDAKKSKEFATNGLLQSKKVNTKDIIFGFYRILSQADSLSGNFKSAYNNYKLFKLYYDSIYNSENANQFNQLKRQADFENKEKDLQLQIENEKLKSSLARKRKQQLVFAWIMTGIILSGAAFTFYRYRRFSKIKAEQKLLKERLAISQDLHDNVGSTLSSISVYSKVAQLQGEENKTEEMNELLGRIRTTSNTMITEMNDIVWAINPGNDSIEKIIQRIEAYAKPLLETRNIRFHFQYDETLFDAVMEMEKRKNFYLIFKEAINNSVKYSAASDIHASMNRQNSHLVLEVKDNGVGFNAESIANTNSMAGNGLRNMQQRANAIQGELKIETSPGGGTLIRLICPV